LTFFYFWIDKKKDVSRQKEEEEQRREKLQFWHVIFYTPRNAGKKERKRDGRCGRVLPPFLRDDHSLLLQIPNSAVSGVLFLLLSSSGKINTLG
jgi:hypothetical protein